MTIRKIDKPLTIQEVKEIIAENGSNRITVQIPVPLSFFSLRIEEQRNVVGKYVVDSRNIENPSHFVMGTQLQPSPHLVTEVTLTVTEEVVQEIEGGLNERELECYTRLDNPLTFEDYMNLAEDNDELKFIVAVPANVMTLNEQGKKKAILALISTDFELGFFDYEVIQIDPNNAQVYLVAVVVTELDKKVQEQLERKSIRNAQYSRFNKKGLYLKTAPISQQEISAASNSNKPVQFLTELDQNEFFHSSQEDLKEHILDQFFTNKESIVRIDLKIVGFNPETDKTITLVTALV